MTAVLWTGGPGSPTNLPPIRRWALEIDDDGNRTYTVVHLVYTNDPADGPETARIAPGLPSEGDVWNYGNDIDLDARCTWYARILAHEHKEGDPHQWWSIEQKFSTRPRKSCEDDVKKPLEQLDRISGSFVKYTEEADKDKDGNAIMSSSFEKVTPPQSEWDANRPTVVIEQNRPKLQLALLARMVDKVNGTPMWGLSPRCVKLSNVSWSMQRDGDCVPYFVRTLEFEIRYETFDRYIMNEGTRALGRYNPVTKVWEVPAGYSSSNYQDFSRYRDKDGEIDHVLLNLDGTPLADGADPTYINPSGASPPQPVKKYLEEITVGLGTFIQALGLPGDGAELFVWE